MSYLDRRLDSLQQLSDTYGWIRVGLVLGGSGLALILSIFANLLLGFGVFVTASIIFFGVVYYHRQILETIRQLEIWHGIKDDLQARKNLAWAQLPESLFTADTTHPFENDFDVVGNYSLHRLLDTTSSQDASKLLRQWLQVTEPDWPTIKIRQSIVRELIDIPMFRQKLRLAGTRRVRELSHRRDVFPFLKWLLEPMPQSKLQQSLYVGAGLVAINVVLLLLNLLAGFPPVWQLTLFLILGYNASRLEVRGLFQEALKAQTTMRQLQTVFTFLEAHRYQDDSALKTFAEPYLNQEESPTHLFNRLGRVVGAAGLQQNPIAWLFVNSVVPWDIYFALQLGKVKADLAKYLPIWLEKWVELDVLSSLADFADQQPSITFPDLITDAKPEIIFNATALGHPLIRGDKRVTNDFEIDQVGDVAILTGSNMAGKSTFLRTIGLNMVLAYAGAPVLAETFKTIPLRLFACIRVTDSVTDGISYFYAEVKRLKSLLDAIEIDDPLPLLYLIDEIFRGTNNRERLIGSHAYIRSLIEKDGVGIIATHDLELVQLADEFDHIRNYHFRDSVKDQKMYFDYILREGPCPTTNALKIMALEGLPVDPENL